MRLAGMALSACAGGIAAAATLPPVAVGPLLPGPSGDPLAIDIAADPLLALGRRQGFAVPFRRQVALAVARSPALAEASADTAATRADRRVARAGLFPSLDASISTGRSFARDFHTDPDLLYEQSRSDPRTDATIGLNQTLLDFGGTSRRIVAASARVRAAEQGYVAQADDVALRAISAWYDVFGYRALEGIAARFADNQRVLRRSVEARIAQGYAAPGDLARVDGYIAGADSHLAQYRRALAGAEARYRALVGEPAPAGLGPVPAEQVPIGAEAVAALAAAIPAVRAAEANAAAARSDVRAARAEALPNLSAGIDAGRYRVLEGNGGYDVRGRLTLGVRLSGATPARIDQASARADAARARADRVRQEAVRDAAIAYTDLHALDDQLIAIQAAYIASRRSRDVLAERFRVARGTLIDLIAAEDGYVDAAANYVRALTERDTAGYILLSRTGRLLDTLGIAADGGGR